MTSQAKAQAWLNFDRLVIAVLFIALFAMAVRTPADTDTWWHLGAGRAIVTTGHIPYADEFSFAVRGKPWTNVQWLAQVGMYIVYSLGGDTVLSVLVAVLVVIVFLYPQMEGAPFLRAFVLILAATATSVIWSPRPQIFRLCSWLSPAISCTCGSGGGPTGCGRSCRYSCCGATFTAVTRWG